MKQSHPRAPSRRAVCSVCVAVTSPDDHSIVFYSLLCSCELPPPAISSRYVSRDTHTQQSLKQALASASAAAVVEGTIVQVAACVRGKWAAECSSSFQKSLPYDFCLRITHTHTHTQAPSSLTLSAGVLLVLVLWQRDTTDVGRAAAAAVALTACGWYRVKLLDRERERERKRAAVTSRD